MASTVWSGTKEFSASGGETTLVPIPMPYRGVLRAYTLVQTSGANNGATCKVLNSNQSTPPNSLLPEAQFVLTEFSIANGETTANAPDVEFSYLNRDGTPSNGQRFLYLKITPGGSGAKNFVFSVTIDGIYLQ